MDTFTPEMRSRIMARVRGKDTRPELLVRSALHALGYRYRLHAPDLPGKPDLVFPRRRKIVFIHGCFWHGHRCRAGQNRPSSNTAYWGAKLERNVRRDRKNHAALRALGWKVFVVWECQLKDLPKAIKKLTRFLGD